MRIRSIGFGVLFAALFVVVLPCGAQEAPPAPVVEIDSGRVSDDATATATAQAAEVDLEHPAGIQREIGYIPMEGGVRLAYILYRPQEGGPFPALFKYNPYWGGGQPIDGRIMTFLRHGYAVLSVSVRGTGCSEGIYTTLTQQGKDGAEIVEWAARQPWCSGAVGMFGISYSGTIQYQVAAHHPEHLKALAASATTNNGYSELAYPGGILNTYLAGWTYVGQPHLGNVGVQLRRELGDLDCGPEELEQAPLLLFELTKQHPFFDELWADNVSEKAAAEIDIPVFIIHAWQDEQVPAKGPVRLFQTVKGPKRLLLSNGGHGFNGWLGGMLETEALRWYDRWLKGEENGVDSEPPVTIWFETRRDEKGQKKPAWIEQFSDWPAPETEYANLYLTADNRLSRKPPTTEEETGQLTYFYPFSTEIINTSEMFSTAPRSPGVISYRTPPMAEDMLILGTPIATLSMSCEEVDTDIMVVLHDIDPDGNTLYLQRGFMRASHRRIDPERSTPHDLFFPHDSEELLTAGEVYKITIPFYPIGHVVRTGHRLELAIMTPPMMNLPTWGFVIKALPGLNTIHHSSEHPSMLELPIIPGSKAKAPAPRWDRCSFSPTAKADEIGESVPGENVSRKIAADFEDQLPSDPSWSRPISCQGPVQLTGGVHEDSIDPPRASVRSRLFGRTA